MGIAEDLDVILLPKGEIKIKAKYKKHIYKKRVTHEKSLNYPVLSTN